MVQNDRLEVEKTDAKNSVEEYVYDMRDKLDTSLQPFVNEQVSVCRDRFCVTLMFTGFFSYCFTFFPLTISLSFFSSFSLSFTLFFLSLSISLSPHRINLSSLHS